MGPGKDLQVKFIVRFVADGKFEAAEADSVGDLVERRGRVFQAGRWRFTGEKDF
jgi:hypothetical protein